MTISAITGRPFPRGAKPTPRHKLLAVQPFIAVVAPPQFAIVPKQLSVWGNDQYGDCVTAEEAFAKACYDPEIFIPEQTVIDWARRHGVLNGAYLTEVMDFMQADGFQVGTQRYNDGKYKGVDYSDETTLQAALATGPVKIAIDANALPSGAGNNQGWYSLGHGNYPNTDHSVALSGYGPAAWLYQQLGVTMPAALAGKSGYLLFTWSTIGFVDHAWLMGTCVEAWIRNPTTVGVPPLTPPPPPPPPVVYTPPFKLYEGDMANPPVQVGDPAGYDTQDAAHNAAVAFAEHDQRPVMVHDAAGVMVETVNPTPPTPPAPQTVTVQFPQTQCVRVGLGQFYVPAMTLTGVVQSGPGRHSLKEMAEAYARDCVVSGNFWNVLKVIFKYGLDFEMYIGIDNTIALFSSGYTTEQIAEWLLAALASYQEVPPGPVPPLPPKP